MKFYTQHNLTGDWLKTTKHNLYIVTEPHTHFKSSYY